MVSSPTFDDGVPHERIDADEWEDIYVVGDVHGCLPELESLLDDLAPSADDLVVFVGDLIRKGPDSIGVVELVRENDNFRSVRGNNEQKLLDGDVELDEFGEAEIEYVRSLPAAISWADALVVHGGVDPRKPLSEHSIDDLETTRSLDPDGSYDRPFWFEEYDGPRRVFFGHTVLERPVEREWAVGLDTGCVYGGTLTAYEYRADEFVTRPSQRTDTSRSDDSIVTPRSH
ncbi:serine/threonine protein phosphatase [Haladaptatus paucihalophilus DX253]|uniref:Serine/threonine protein phosphatase n=1 Tax=Haladaptatus paucihalophilus DX253 TaxID=797209 RepID=E7QTB4_HALPU|nr:MULTISPECIES: metallophosphoesterase family protein [Haladaptatus]EFW91843.1 serine/threonine protein phosphatase [Haladaptatus paucihalophilus DX253]GKZ14009.1 serine/threonine protein phosphatase [Haladaptatus sp. T7]SHK80926.1 serine/threonine protein phosphatase 1 [Haladaptatus paucihalophilus DX253]